MGRAVEEAYKEMTECFVCALMSSIMDMCSEKQGGQVELCAVTHDACEYTHRKE